MIEKVYTKIDSIVGNVITVRAEGVRNNDLAEITTASGTGYANVIKLDGDKVSLQVFKGGQGVSTGDSVRFLGVPMRVSYSDNLLGRVFDGAGKPRDNGPELTDNMVEIGGPSVNPSKRILPNKMIRTGIPMIDVFNTLVESQKLPIFSVSGEPYNELLARIAMQAEVDVIVLGGLGYEVDVGRIMSISIGLLITVMGNYLPRCRYNFTMGIRTPWTLNDPQNWTRTHRLAGYCWTPGGIVMAVLGYFRLAIPYFAVLVVITMVPAVYSYVLYRKKGGEGEHD